MQTLFDAYRFYADVTLKVVPSGVPHHRLTMSSWLRFGHDIGVIGDQVFPSAYSSHGKSNDLQNASASQWRSGAGGSVVGGEEEDEEGFNSGGLNGAQMSLKEMQLIFTGVNSRHVHDPNSADHAMQHALSYPEFLEGILHIACTLYKAHGTRPPAAGAGHLSVRGGYVTAT